MSTKAVVNLSTGLEDAERVTVAFLMAVGAAEQGRQTMMFLSKEAVRLAVPGVAVATACDGCPPLPELLDRYERAGGRLHGMSDLREREEAGLRHADRRRRGGRHRPALAMDRRRGRDDVQLLIAPGLCPESHSQDVSRRESGFPDTDGLVSRPRTPKPSCFLEELTAL